MLYIVPTPIGNKGDISKRAIEVLQVCDFIIAENPSYSKRFLTDFNIQKQILQFAEHNEHLVLDRLITRLQTENACLISDAGTPGISDPGFRLVRGCLEKNIEITALPGANAAATALSASGLPTDKFFFAGFLPKTEPKLFQLVEQSKEIEATLVAYESPQRILKTLERLKTTYPKLNVVVARELTKLHEEYVRGTAEEVFENFKARPSIKGEIVLLASFK